MQNLHTISPVQTIADFGLHRRYLFASAGSPADLSNLVLFLDASDSSTLYSDAGKTVNTAAGGDVYVWADKSGQGNDVSQAATGKYPLRKAGVVNGGASFGTLRFDGYDDFLQGGVFASALTVPYTLWAVARPFPLVWRPGHITEGYNEDHRLILGMFGSRAFIGPDLTGTPPLYYGSSRDTNWYLFQLEFGPTETILRIDGVVDIAGPTSIYAPEGITVGADERDRHTWSGDIALIAIQDGLPTPDEVAAIYAYVSNKFGIVIGA